MLELERSAISGRNDLSGGLLSKLRASRIVLRPRRAEKERQTLQLLSIPDEKLAGNYSNYFQGPRFSVANTGCLHTSFLVGGTPRLQTAHIRCKEKRKITQALYMCQINRGCVMRTHLR